MALRADIGKHGRHPLRQQMRNVDSRIRAGRRAVREGRRRLQAEIEAVELTPGPAGPSGAQGREGAPGPQGPPGTTVQATVAETGADGRATWTFTTAFDTPPVVTASPVDPNPGDLFTVTATLETVTTGQVTLRVWQTLSALVPAGAGVHVHLIAVPLD